MSVEVFTREHPGLIMTGVVTAGFKHGKNGAAVSNQLKVLRGKESDILFHNIDYLRSISFSVDSASFKDFFYLEKDDEGYIFNSNP
ncbi:hypothetical protein J1780_19495 [Rahnella aceris]|uniref:hypothetical protein n=1 Tax=Rahnella sp. (strain Y9602) TaxID=2703885 RepID=UPI001C27CFFF|nr:hypothetical protein [Rahnella aceris]MBU9842136.1 hypothetical protein [Rahnella aceris]